MNKLRKGTLYVITTTTTSTITSIYLSTFIGPLVECKIRSAYFNIQKLDQTLLKFCETNILM